jgi:hypothetical protein
MRSLITAAVRELLDGTRRPTRFGAERIILKRSSVRWHVRLGTFRTLIQAARLSLGYC